MRARVSIMAACLVLASVCRSAEPACESKSGSWLDTQRRLEQQRQRLEDIEQQILQEQRCVEQWHSRSLVELRQTAERKARTLLTSEAALWTYFTRSTGETPYLFGEIGSRFPRRAGILLNRQQMTTGQTWASLRLYEAMAERYLLSSMRDLLMNEDFRNMLCEIADSTDVKDARVNLLRAEARRLMRIMDELRLESNRLEEMKREKLAALAGRGEYLKSGVLQTMCQIRARKGGDRGVVAAVCQMGEQWICTVEGVDGLLRPGVLTQGGVKVVAIREGGVEFEKGVVRWEQKVGQVAGDQWD